MAIYTVLAPPARDSAPASAAPDPLRFVFVKEGLAWPALFFALPWLIFRRMWLVLLAYVAVMVVLSVADARLGGPLFGIGIAAVHLFLILEGNQLRRWTLERAGYRLAGVVEGRGIEEAEIRWFAEVEPAAAVIADAPAAAPPPEPTAPTVPPAPPVPPSPWRGPESAPMAPPSAEGGDIVGLFPAPASPGSGR